MCLVSSKIKFCTCVSKSVDQLKHYWILHRFVEGKDELILGMPVMPSELSDINFEINSKTLANRLNESDAFDMPIAFKENDQLEIVINNNRDSYSDIFTYCFKFKKGKWRKEEFDTFHLLSKYDEFASGKMKNVIKKTTKAHE